MSIAHVNIFVILLFFNSPQPTDGTFNNNGFYAQLAPNVHSLKTIPFSFSSASPQWGGGNWCSYIYAGNLYMIGYGWGTYHYSYINASNSAATVSTGTVDGGQPGIADHTCVC